MGTATQPDRFTLCAHLRSQRSAAAVTATNHGLWPCGFGGMGPQIIFFFCHPCSRPSWDFLRLVAGSALLTVKTFGCSCWCRTLSLVHQHPHPQSQGYLRSPVLLPFQGGDFHLQGFKQGLTEDFSNFCSPLTTFLTVPEEEKYKGGLKLTFTLLLSCCILLQGWSWVRLGRWCRKM